MFFFAFITIAFIAFAYFFPEWVGITGRKAHEINEHQKSNGRTSDSISELEKKL